jgi:hypothetical protein
MLCIAIATSGNASQYEHWQRPPDLRYPIVCPLELWHSDTSAPGLMQDDYLFVMGLSDSKGRRQVAGRTSNWNHGLKYCTSTAAVSSVTTE